MRAVSISAAIFLVSIPQCLPAKPADAAIAAHDRKDYPTALKLWLPRATRGEMTAQLGVGLLYFNGAGVKQNYPMALKWLRKAADQRKPRSSG